MERNLEPKKEKLEADRRSTQKYDEKVNEWKVWQHSNESLKPNFNVHKFDYFYYFLSE